MTECLASALVLSGLRRRQHEALRLDGAGADQRVPVGPPRRHREGRGNGDELSAGVGERAIEMRETQVVANREADFSPRQLGHDSLAAGLEMRALAMALAPWEIHVEHVDLVVAGGDSALRREEVGAVGDLAGGREDAHRADVQPYPEFARQRAEMG